jgi:hypothetical protein
MTSRELIRWSRLHERRAGKLPSLAVPILIGGALAAWVGWRTTAGLTAASHAWLAGAVVAFAIGFLRVPFHVYWRPDAALLAQLPIEGRPLFDAALVRCLRAALGTAVAVVIGAVPLVITTGPEALARHVAVALALAAAAAWLIPAVTVAAAAIVVHGASALRTATALAGAPAVAERTASGPPTSPAAVLGALPGFAATGVIAAVIEVSAWLVGGDDPAPVVLGVIAGVSVIAVIAARAGASVMALVLRDVSALDRQRLATLQITPPTAIERAIAGAIGAAALPYAKNARLMRRRFPMAYALGGIAFLVLIVIGIARPTDAAPWLTVAIAGAASYGLVLAGRLRQLPIEHARLSVTLPITTAARDRAKLAWLLGWWAVYVVAPAVFAALRQAEPAFGLVLLAAATVIVTIAGAISRRYDAA